MRVNRLESMAMANSHAVAPIDYYLLSKGLKILVHASPGLLFSVRKCLPGFVFYNCFNLPGQTFA